MKNEPIFSASHLSFFYEKVNVLTDISFTIQPGERVAILGANGSGKSTLLKILNALHFASSGTLRFTGNILNEEYFKKEETEFAFRRQVGFVFQDPDVQLFNPTVWDEVLFGPLHLGIDKNKIVKRAEEALDLVGITRLRHRSPFTLSGGEKKRVALASILSIRPSVWLMDEPLASLDPRSQSRLIDFLSAARDRGETIIISTHDIALLSELADRVLVISEDHKLIADCDIQELLKRTDFLLKHNLMHRHAHSHGKKRHSHKHMHDNGHKKH